MKQHICFALDSVAFPIQLIQTGRNVFTVRYGKQIKRGLTYSQAARELGECIMHARACDGELDNRMPGE